MATSASRSANALRVPRLIAHNYSLTVSAADARKGAGKKLGIEIANVRDNGIGVDNVRLKTK